jgi:hypothetical protein
LTFDLDTVDDPTHGAQQLSFVVSPEKEELLKASGLPWTMLQPDAFIPGTGGSNDDTKGTGAHQEVFRLADNVGGNHS